MVSQWLFWGAVGTLAVGAIGVLGARRLMPLLAYAVIGSMGTVMMAVAAFSPQAASAALYYLVHSTFAAAVLFLVADLVTARRAHDGLSAQPPVPQNGLYAALFFGGAIAMAGMPPLSGFLGKLLVMDSLRDPAFLVTGWTAILLGSLVTIVGFARAGSVVFWKATAIAPAQASARDDATGEHAPAAAAPAPPAATPAELAPTVGLLLVLGALAIFAGPLSHYTAGAAAQLFDPAGYIDAVLARVQEG
jgi:multicomponent K+:H+ antiporter subunit D